MSFTEDELQAFNSVLEQRFATLRREMEQAVDQRLENFQQTLDHRFQQTLDHRFAHLQQEILTCLKQQSASEQDRGDATLTGDLDEQHEQIVQLFTRQAEQQSSQIEATVDRMLAAQLLGIEQILSQHMTRRQAEVAATDVRQLEAIEIQTELSWDDLVAVMGQALDERLVSLGDSLQLSVKNLEHYLTTRFHGLRDELTRLQGNRPAYPSVNTLNNGTSIQEVLAGIEQLERVMESMQVAMTANHALLSNRLYHHQQLPLERAHPGANGQTRVSPASRASSLLASAKEQLAGEPESRHTDEGDEPTGH